MSSTVTEPASDSPSVPPATAARRRPLTAARIHTLRTFVWFWRKTIAIVAIGYFLAAITVLVTQFVVLPKVPEYREEIAALVSRGIGERVTIGRIETGWRGLHPRELPVTHHADREERHRVERQQDQ